MKNLEINVNRLYFTSGRTEYSMTVLDDGRFFVEVAEDGMLVSDNRSSRMKRKLEAL